MVKYLLLFLLLSFGLNTDLKSQEKGSNKKYPSLFWEISGKGLQKPSYLFGTMHVSSKMAFHLSDSFYYALKNCDKVALELNPEDWQKQMFRMQDAQMGLTEFYKPSSNNFINEKSFQFDDFRDNLKRALTEEPMVVNNLLYRSYQSRADFEENTYLDLYIYQTGRKLGKQPEGVEDYMESQRLMFEAYRDRAKEKNRKKVDTDGESMYSIEKKIQDAYRRGDLDLLDSLQQITMSSEAFNEKFIYKRNEIQANSIDTILANYSLFVGVGAAHLPGPRGVIEMLRQKGYILRPIFMQDRDAAQKDAIDKLKVPVKFQQITTEDHSITLMAPGQMFKREDNRWNSSRQYADMSNGSYYMLTRVLTHAAMNGFSESRILERIDSMLYESIPGKIITKTEISKNGYKGFDITNKTRRGDVQRYRILVTPFEVLVFKMSGIDDYVSGKEADIFFNSIEVKGRSADKWVQYQPPMGGFSVKMPQMPHMVLNPNNADQLNRMEYTATDKQNNAYAIVKKTVYNLNFIEEDSFDLGMLEESFKRWELVDKTLSRKTGVKQKIPFVEAKYSLKDGGFAWIKALVDGPHYYLVAARSNDKNADMSKFLNSFSFTPYLYGKNTTFVDSILKIKVETPVKPDLDTTLASWLVEAQNEQELSGNISNYWPTNKNAVFSNDTTGEAVFVIVQNFPKYYFSRDSVLFWQDKLDEKNVLKDMVFSRKDFFKMTDSVCGYNVVLSDTNSARNILHKYVLKGDRLFRFSTVVNALQPKSQFIQSFFETAGPIDETLGLSVFQNKVDSFFTDYYSSDSLTKKRANQAISAVYYGKNGIDKILEAINKLKYSDKDYFELKSKFITELGYIDDSCCKERIVTELRKIYNQTSDTSYFQHPVINALARQKTASSFGFLKEIFLNDPPVFENNYEFNRIFRYFSDTLPLAKNLFPELFQLATVDEYKKNINNLLIELIDSSLVKADDYRNYFNQLFFDAKIQLKKQRNLDERILQKESKKEESTIAVRNIFSSASSIDHLSDYCNLLMPFYKENEQVRTFFERVLVSKDPEVQMTAAILLLKNNYSIPDTLLENIASKDLYRSRLLAKLEKIGKENLFPEKYYSRELIARSLLLSNSRIEEFASIELVEKQLMSVKNKRGYAYLFRYKLKDNDDWKMGISGLQPIDTNKISSENDLVKMTDRKLKTNEPTQTQFDEQLLRMIYGKHKSSRNFFLRSSFNYLGN